MRNYLILLSMLMIFTILAGGGQSRAAEKGISNRGAGQKTQWTFDKEQVGKPPTGAAVFAGIWVVRAESGAPSPPNVLCQSGLADYPALALSNTVYSDVGISTYFKAVSGNSDRAAGIIFRIQDKDNYYILRANALEDNVNIYKYVNGSRRVIKEGSAKVPSSAWQQLRVEAKGNRIRGFLNGKQVVEATDNTFSAGKIGLWTKADSVTCFDNVQVDQPI